jgi:sulfoacetaldehyde dehydrogenase
VQVLPPPASKEMTAELMRLCDLVVVTGSQANVRRPTRAAPRRSGWRRQRARDRRRDADLPDAARKIAASKTFDNATSCSSENALVVLDACYDAALERWRAAGGYSRRRQGARSDRPHAMAGRQAEPRRHRPRRRRPGRAFGLGPGSEGKRFFLVEEEGIGPEHPLSGEKLSLVLSVYRARDFDHAVEITRRILEFQGKGHSCGIHTRDMDRARRLAAELPVVRVLVNQAHTFGNGGGFDNGLNFTLSMGCGTWGGNSISENLSYRHFLNITHLVTTIPEDRPGEDELFGPFWAKYGR